VTSGLSPQISPSGILNAGSNVPTNNFALNVPYSVNTIVFQFVPNQYTAQMEYRWSPNYPSPAILYPTNGLSSQSYTCDSCAGGTAISCNTPTGPGAQPSPVSGYSCANFVRTYTFSGLQASVANQSPTINSFAVQLYDRNTNPGPDTTSYSFTIVRFSPPIVGDPEIIGLQGQDFQVHGIPDEIFNLISAPNVQVNGRFVYLSSGACHDNFTACFAHPGTYIGEEGIRVGSDRIHVAAGSFKKGLSVSLNGKKVSSSTKLKIGSIEMVSHRRVIVQTPLLNIQISNSDKFLNQETSLNDNKLIDLGNERRVLNDNEQFHPEVPLHGLQGQTWRNVEYPSGLEYEGSISDYHITDGNLYGTNFVFNQFQQ